MLAPPALVPSLIHPSISVIDQGLCLKDSSEAARNVKLATLLNSHTNSRKKNTPKSLLDAPDVILQPVPLSNLLLSDRNPRPLDAHDRDMVDVVLVKLDLQLGVVVLGPLVQSPALDDLGRRLQLQVLSRDISPKQLELASLFRAFEDFGWCSRECGNALRVGKSLVELLGGGAELLVVGHRGGIDDAARAGLRRGDGLGLGPSRCWRVVLRGGEAARGVRAGRVLDVLAMFGDQGGEELEEFGAQLGDDLRPDEVLNRLLFFGVGVDVDLEL